MDIRLAGSYVALPTPFRDGHVDLAAFRSLVEWHRDGASAGVVVCGTTGEAATLEDDERRLLLETAVEVAGGRTQVIAGVGTNGTRTTARLAREACRAGADALLVVTPYYNRPGPRGLLWHYGAVSEASDRPVILYNVPTRTGVDLKPELAAEIAASCPNVIGIKEAAPEPERVDALAAIDGFSVLAGDDTQIAAFVARGATGVVGVASNLVPDRIAELVRAASEPGATRAARLQEALAPLLAALSVEVNPVPVKAALARLGLCRAEVRLPLAPLEPASVRILDAALVEAGLVLAV